MILRGFEFILRGLCLGEAASFGGPYGTQLGIAYRFD